jgi:PAS domain S-box-containing protein
LATRTRKLSTVSRTSEISYRFLVEGIVDVAIFMVEPDGTIASWNRAAQRIKGYAANEIIGQHFSRFFCADDVARHEPDRILSIAKTQGKYEGEGWRLRKDGGRFWAQVVVDALHDEKGKLVGFAKITRDVTERSIKEEQRRVVVDAAPNGMLIVDEFGTITLANPQAERIFGYRPGAIAGLPPDELLTGAAIDLPAYRNALPALENSAALSDFCALDELTGRRRDGSAFAVEVTFNATLTARGPVVVASISDLTERRAAEEQRRAAETALSSANHLMTMAEPIAQYGHWRFDLATKNIVWSQEVYRTFGLPSTYVPTLENSLVCFDPEGADVAAIVGRATVDGEPFSYETRILRPDGTYRDVRCSARAERDGDGGVTALVGIFQDVTEQKENERERERLIERVALATHAGHVGIWEWDVNAEIMGWDAHMFALYGLDTATDRPTFGTWKSALHHDDRTRVMHELYEGLTGRKAFDTEFRIIWPNGETHAIRAQATIVRNANDKPVLMICINRDVTAVRSLSEQLQEQKERERERERERLYEHERRQSTTFQRAVLPLALPVVAGCTFDAVYEPGMDDAQVGGDWYDAVHLMDGRILVSIGDVAGSGLEAAVVVGVARQIMRGISQLHANPMLILDAADRALCLEYPGIYVSAWVGLIDLVTRTITYASAGHPPPLLVSRDGAVRELADPTSLLIGLREGHRGQANTISIAQGDSIVLYTDGLTEAGRDAIEGGRALREAASALATQPARDPAGAIRRRVIPDGAPDDVALLVVRTDCREAERYIERQQFDVSEGAAAAAARASFIESLEGRGFGADQCANAELIFSELIGNVVRHAHAKDVEVAVDHGGPYSVLHVMDRGSGFHHISRLPPDPYAENGRGLFLIAALSVDFTVAAGPDGGSHARVILRGGQRANRTRPAFLRSPALT